jgi:glycosyltransferase involved in cell wall biosynthesis
MLGGRVVTLKIAFITAGAAGMFCGSCIRDNALVSALRGLGHDALLIPTYTPVTLDEPDQSTGRIFMGGINVYLQDKSWLFRHTPRWFDWLLDRPWLLKWAGRFATRTKYENLGGLTISMLKGSEGRQKKEVGELVDFLKEELKPDVVILTNVLLSGLVPTLQEALGVPIVATLQGDDIFLDALRPADRTVCLDLIRRNASHFAGLIATSRYYADHMSEYLGIDRGRIGVVPAGIDLKGHGPSPESRVVPTVGFFARVAPEKGFHNLVHAFIRLRKTPNAPAAKLRASGWFGEQHRPYFDEQLKKLESAGLRGDFEYVDSPDHVSKVRFLNSVDVLSVPTTYKEPKGLYVFEAWANGVPVVLPDHGCFSELVNDTGGGTLVPPGDTDALATALGAMLADPARRAAAGEAGRVAVTERYSAVAMAKATEQYLKTFKI